MYTITITLFATILLLREWSLSYRIKQLLKLDQFEKIKLLDCFPCFSFWASIIVVLFTHENIIYSLATFVIASILDKLWN